MRPFRTGHASISGWDDPGMRPLRLRTPGACVYLRFGKTSMRPLRAGHASIPESAECRLASIAESAEPACVQFPKGMRLFPGRLNASLRQFRDRMSRACVNSGFRYARHASIAHSACVIFGFGEPGACVHFAFGQASMRPFPAGHASISASAERELAFISGSDERGMRPYRARFDPGMRPFQVGTIPACVHYGFGHQGLASIFDSARPACVHCARGMHQFPSRLNAGLRLLRSRLNRLASNSRRACVYFLAG